MDIRDYEDYDHKADYEEGVALVVKGDRYWHINKKGKAVYKERYGMAWPFRDGIAWVRESKNVWFHINKKGKAVYKERFDFIWDCQKGLDVIKEKRNRQFNWLLIAIIIVLFLGVLVLL